MGTARMSALAAWRGRDGLSLARFWPLTLVLGAGIGLAAAAGQMQIAVVIALLPAIVALLLQPEWLPPVLLLTVFAEALATGTVTLSRVGGPLALLVMIIALPSRKRVRLPHWGVLLAVIAYSAWAFASVQWTINSDLSLQMGTTGYALSSLALSLIYMVAMIMFVRTKQDLVRIMWTAWALSTLTGLISIAQYLSGFTRSYGLSGDANFFAALQVVVLPMGALLAIETRNMRTRVIVLIGVAINVGSIMTSLSRGGILALVTVFVLLSLQPARGFFRTAARKRAFLIFVAVGAGILLAVSYSALSAKTSSLFAQGGGDGGSGRANLWRAAVTGWHEHEIRGIGFGAFISQSNQLLIETPGVSFSDYRLRPTGQYVHNAYLESLVELGVIGAVLFVAVLASTMLSLRATSRRAAERGQVFLSSFARVLMLSLAGYAFTSIFLSSETDRTIWVLVGLAVALPRVLREDALRVTPPYVAADTPVGTPVPA
jgi:O-antigen ligase